VEITKQALSQMNDNPLYRALGIRIEEADEGRAVSRLKPDPKLCWPFPTQPHGGILFTLMDTTMAWAVFSTLDPGYNCTTVHLDIQYIHPAKGDLFNCVAHLTHKTGHMGFVRAEIQAPLGSVLAMGQATFRIIESKIMAWED
jgi:uncharacterized protein (TIGR00369 family)